MVHYRYDDCNTFFQKIGKIGHGAILPAKMSLLSQPKLLAAGWRPFMQRTPRQRAKGLIARIFLVAQQKTLRH